MNIDQFYKIKKSKKKSPIENLKFYQVIQKFSLSLN